MKFLALAFIPAIIGLGIFAFFGALYYIISSAITGQHAMLAAAQSLGA